MEKRIKITEEESLSVQKLFMRFNGYCGILGYLSNYGSIDSDKFDKKWEEALEVQMELETLKSKIDKKYHPTDGEYTTYFFNFDDNELVYT